MNFDQWRWEMRGLPMEKLRRPREAIAAYERAYALDPAKLRNALYGETRQGRFRESRH